MTSTRLFTSSTIRSSSARVCVSLAEPPQLTLSGFAAMFQPVYKDSIWRFVAGLGLLAPARLPFMRYASTSMGPQYLLGWRERVEEVTLAEATAIMSSAIAWVQRSGGVRTSVGAS